MSAFLLYSCYDTLLQTTLGAAVVYQ